MPNLLDTLRALEIALHDPVNRYDAAKLNELLHPSFKEFGRSGASYSFSDIISQSTPSEVLPKIHAQDFAVEALSEDFALLTYRSAYVDESGGLYRHTNRSSLWQLSESGWQMRFHQGTPTAAW